MTQHSDAIVKEKWERASGRTGNNTAVDRWAAPRGVALHVIRSADAPKIFAVIKEVIAERKAEKLVRFRRFDGIFKIICISVALVAEVKPRMRILMGENGVIS